MYLESLLSPDNTLVASSSLPFCWDVSQYNKDSYTIPILHATVIHPSAVHVFALAAAARAAPVNGNKYNFITNKLCRHAIHPVSSIPIDSSDPTKAQRARYYFIPCEEIEMDFPCLLLPLL